MKVSYVAHGRTSPYVTTSVATRGGSLRVLSSSYPTPRNYETPSPLESEWDYHGENIVSMLSRCSLDSRTCIQRVFSSRLSSEVGYYFRHPTGAFSKPETLGQKRLGAAIEREITNLLNLDAIFKEGLVERHGCSVHKVLL